MYDFFMNVRNTKINPFCVCDFGDHIEDDNDTSIQRTGFLSFVGH